MLKRCLAALLAGLLLMTSAALAAGSFADRASGPKATPRLPSCDDALASMEETPTPAPAFAGRASGPKATPRLPSCDDALASTEETPTPAPTPAPDSAGAISAMDPDALTAKAYVFVSTATQAGWLPLPDEGEYSWHLQQILPDGTPAENVVHVTVDSVYMEDSTCENHDCVQQGLVTLDNREERILGNMIICLPNQVFLQLFTADEVRDMLRQG